MTAPITADLYFKQNEHKAQSAFETPVFEAHKVQAGDRITITGFINIMTRAEEDGFLVKFDRDSKFMTPEEYTEFKSVCEPFISDGAEDLPAGAKVVPVKKGQTIMTQPWSDTTLGVQAEAEADGFLVTLPETGKARFMSDATFRAVFNANANLPAKSDDQELLRYVPQADDIPVRYIVLDTDVTFDFEEGAYNAPAGSVLYENPDDVDGFTVTPAASFAERFSAVPAANTAKAPSPKTPRP